MLTTCTIRWREPIPLRALYGPVSKQELNLLKFSTGRATHRLCRAIFINGGLLGTLTHDSLKPPSR